MQSNNNNTAQFGIGFADVLLILFIALKLCGVITWSWVWVLSPFWIGIAIYAVILAAVIIASKISDRRKR